MTIEGDMKKRPFIREKRIYCGERYMEVDIFPYTEEQESATRKSRKKKHRITPPKQDQLNDKNARRYFTQLVNGNFGSGDYHVTLTYASASLPETVDEAEHQVRCYLRRIAYRRKKQGIPPLKYVLVTEGGPKKDGSMGRIHHHLIMDGGMEREAVEALWCHRRRKGEKNCRRIGFVNADRLQPDENGLTALASYLSKDPSGKKRWSCSQNLDRPYFRRNDNKYSRRKVERLVKDPLNVEFWEKQYPSFELLRDGYIVEYNEIGGWSVYLKMKKKEVKLC